MTNFELIELETEETLSHYSDESDINQFTTSYKFDAYFEDDNENLLELDGMLTLELSEEDNSFNHDFGTQTEINIIIDRVDIMFYKCKKRAEEIQSLKQQIEDYVINVFYN
jgi:hypothetical protein